MLDFITQVYCINLQTRDDKFAIVQHELERVGITAQFHRPAPDSRGGRVGCWQSHRWCLERVAQGPAEWALIFEDDVKFDAPLVDVRSFLETSDCELLMLGGTVVQYIQPATRDIWRAAVNQTHAYVVSRRAAQRITADPTFTPVGTMEGVDDWYRQNTQMYAVVPFTCVQRAGVGSDIQWHRNTFVQRTFQDPRWYEAVQRAANRWAWWLRWLPMRVQPWLNPLPCLLLFNDWLSRT